MKPFALLVYILVQLGTPPAVSQQIAGHVQRYSTKYEIDPYLVVAVIYHESRGRRCAHNENTYDHGLMQIHCPSKDYAPWCRNIKKLKQLKHNIKTGVHLLSLRKKRCVGKHRHKSHWIRHNNWHNKKYDVKVLATHERIKRLEREYVSRSRNPGLARKEEQRAEEERRKK